MIRSHILPRLFALLCALLLIPAPEAFAQVLYGSVAGTVEDSTGAVVPGATVTVTDQATNQSRQATTTNDGTYVIPDLPAGSYTLAVAAQGFRTSQTRNILVSINNVTRSDVHLSVGERAETVTVEADAAAIQTDSADVHTSLSSAQITQLPLPGYRNYQTLINLVPGATPAAY